MNLNYYEAHALLRNRKENMRRTRLTEAQISAIYVLASHHESPLTINEIVSRYDLSHNTVKLAVASRGHFGAYEYGREFLRESLATAVSWAEWWLDRYSARLNPDEALKKLYADLDESLEHCAALQAASEELIERADERTALIFDKEAENKELRRKLKMTQICWPLFAVVAVILMAVAR